jgi:hypothetical protein
MRTSIKFAVTWGLAACTFRELSLVRLSPEAITVMERAQITTPTEMNRRIPRTMFYPEAKGAADLSQVKLAYTRCAVLPTKKLIHNSRGVASHVKSGKQ